MRHLVTYILLLFFLADIHSQIIPFKNYNVRDGLPSNAILDIKQDQKGFMWIATENGLVKFDGYNFKTFTVEDGLEDNFIRKILICNNNAIYAGGYSGKISLIQDDSFQTIGYKEEELEGEVLDIFQDRVGKIWCSTINGLFYLIGDTLFQVKDNNISIDESLWCHYEDVDGKLWVSLRKGLFVIDSNIKKINWPELNGKIITGIIQDTLGRFLFSTNGTGLFIYDGNEISTYPNTNCLSTQSILSILESKRGDVFVGTSNHGIKVIKSNGIFDKSIAPEISIKSIIEDNYGRIWARTVEEGVLLIENDNFKHIDIRKGLADNSISCMFEDFNSNLWIGTDYGGISVYQNSIFERYIAESEEGAISVTSIKYKNKKIYAGTDNALHIIENNEIGTSFFAGNGLSEDPYIYSIAEGKDDKIWLGTMGGVTSFKNDKFKYYKDTIFYHNWYKIWSNSIEIKGDVIYMATEKGLIMFDGNEYLILSEEDGLINNDLYSVKIDLDGNIWCGSSEGLSIFNGKEFRNFTEFEGLSNNFCNDICFDSKGVAWIATDLGVTAAIFDKNNLSTRNYSTKDGLASNSIFSVVSDHSDNIWLGHNVGVDKLNPRTKEVKNYGFLEGFLPLENNLGSIDVDEDGNVWFGTVEGVVKYNPKNDRTNFDPPKIYITSIKLNNDTTDITDFYSEIDSTTNLPLDLQLPYDTKRNVYFEYVGLHYKNVPKNKYKYRLLGYEENWSEPTTEIVTPPYRKLPNGKYTFQLLAANSDDVWTIEPVEFSFKILPPWWKTIWARILEVVFFIGLLFLIIHLRERKLKYDKKVLKQKVIERTIEVVEQKNQIEIQRDEISKQKQEITDSIRYAEHIQSAILPKDITISEHLSDYFILFKPRDIVSGDFYWIDKVDDKIVAIAADCTGHGVPGAFMSMLGVSILNQIAFSKVELSAHYILNQLREKIISTLSHTRKDEVTRDGMDIALCIIDFNNNQVEYAGAYNPLVLIRNGESEIFKGDKMPVGLMPGELKPFISHKINVQKGDCLYMFSDGYADQFGGPNGKKFKIAPFRNLLIENSHKPMQEQKQVLDDTIMDWMANEEQIDDILVIGIRV